MHNEEVDVGSHLRMFYRIITVTSFVAQRSDRYLVGGDIQILGVQRDIFGALDHEQLYTCMRRTKTNGIRAEDISFFFVYAYDK